MSVRPPAIPMNRPPTPATRRLVLAFIAACCLQPIANFAFANLVNQDLLLIRLPAYYVALLGVVLIAYLVLDRLTSRRYSTALGLWLALGVLFMFNEYWFSALVRPWVDRIGVHRVVYLFEAVVLAAGVAVAISLARSRAVLLVALAFVVGATGWDALQFGRLLAAVESGGTPPSSPVTRVRIPGDARTPNVYFVLPDTHVGEAVVRRWGLPTSFFDGLRARGYYVVDEAVTNATVTVYSMAHLLSMQFVFEQVERLTPEYAAQVRATSLERMSAVHREFAARGFALVHVSDGYDGPECRGFEDICIAGKRWLVEQDFRFLSRSPFLRLFNALSFPGFAGPTVLLTYPNRMEVPEIIERLPPSSEGPFFLFMHLSLPHPPYRYNEHCEYQRPPYGRQAFIAQLQCTGKLLLDLVDQIERNDPSAIVIVQADTGITPESERWKAPHSQWSRAEIEARLSILSAFRGPAACIRHLRPGLSPVNTFRWVFACLDDEAPEYLPDRSWLVHYLGTDPRGRLAEWNP